eukprot:SAG22_NODE_969_length_6231_cov_4.839041_7_plen_203_part_00
MAGIITAEDVCAQFGAADYSGFAPGLGTMYVVSGIERATLERAFRATGDANMVISAQYTSSRFMVSGPAALLECTLQELQHKLSAAADGLGVRASALAFDRIAEVDYAYHSPMHKLRWKPPRRPATGGVLGGVLGGMFGALSSGGSSATAPEIPLNLRPKVRYVSSVTGAGVGGGGHGGGGRAGGEGMCHFEQVAHLQVRQR